MLELKFFLFMINKIIIWRRLKVGNFLGWPWGGRRGRGRGRGRRGWGRRRIRRWLQWQLYDAAGGHGWRQERVREDEDKSVEKPVASLWQVCGGWGAGGGRWGAAEWQALHIHDKEGAHDKEGSIEGADKW